MQSRLTILASRSSFGVGEDLVRANIIVRDKTSQKYILLAMKHYATALNLDTKYVYQALPRLLSLWFDFVSIRPDHISFEDLEQSSKKSCAGKDFEFELTTYHPCF